MAQPTFYEEGSTQRRRDTRLRKWKKILGLYQDSGGLPANDPRQRDAYRRTKLRLLNSLNGTSTN